MAQTLNYRPKSYPGLLRLTFYLKTRPNWSGHFVLIKKQTQIGPCSSRPIQRFKKGPHNKTEKKNWRGSSSSSNWNSSPFCAAVNEKVSKSNQSNQIQTRLKTVSCWNSSSSSSSSFTVASVCFCSLRTLCDPSDAQFIRYFSKSYFENSFLIADHTCVLILLRNELGFN